MEAYRDYLNKEIEKTAKKYEEAKKEAIKDIQSMTVHQAVNYGAGYLCHIDKITKYAAKLEALAEAFRAYEYMEEK